MKSKIDTYKSTSLWPKETGLSRTIYVTPRYPGMEDYPLLWIEKNTNGKRSHFGYEVGFARDGIVDLSQLPEEIRSDIGETIRHFIEANVDGLLAFWDDNIGVVELTNRIKQVHE